MNRYLRYLRDNPEGYWFKRKVFGLGWTPVNWKGFAALLLYIAGVVYILVRVDRSSHSVSDTLIGILVPVVLLTVVLIVICIWKGQKPRWQWGLNDAEAADREERNSIKK